MWGVIPKKCPPPTNHEKNFRRDPSTTISQNPGGRGGGGLEGFAYKDQARLPPWDCHGIVSRDGGTTYVPPPLVEATPMHTIITDPTPTVAWTRA